MTKRTSAESMRIAASKTLSEGGQQYDLNPTYPLQRPKIFDTNERAQMALDDAYNFVQPYLNNCVTTFNGFPGFPYLAQLSTRAEYRTMAETIGSEITRKWIEIKSTSEVMDHSEKIKQLVDYMDTLDVREAIKKVATNDCFFGRGHLCIVIDNQNKEVPLILSPATVPQGSLKSVVSVDPVWCTPLAYNALDPTRSDFYRPNKWMMLGQEIHASRLLNIVTRELPDMLKPAFNFAGMSLSQLAEPYVNNWLRTRQSVSDLVSNFSITALKTAMDQVLQGDDDGSDIIARAKLFIAMRNNQNLMMLDSDREEIVQVNTPLSGLHELQAQAQEHMCSTSRIPAVILTGISPSGLNASSEGEIRVFYDWISAQQEAYYRYPIDIIFKVAQLSLFGEIDPDLMFEFVPLYQMSEKEQAEIREIDARVDQVYLSSGVVDAAEVRQKIATSIDSGYQGIDVDDVPEQMPNPAQENLDDDQEPEQVDAEDESVSKKQHNAMEAAAHGKSTIGIPQSVGQEFVDKDASK